MLGSIIYSLPILVSLFLHLALSETTPSLSTQRLLPVTSNPIEAALQATAFIKEHKLECEPRRLELWLAQSSFQNNSIDEKSHLEIGTVVKQKLFKVGGENQDITYINFPVFVEQQLYDFTYIQYPPINIWEHALRKCAQYEITVYNCRRVLTFLEQHIHGCDANAHINKSNDPEVKVFTTKLENRIMKLAMYVLFFF